ncbi:CBS domain-containing protein [bacterium]|nr:CBS domain-containing protein [bacterium]
MDLKNVKDLMIPIDEYVVVKDRATLYEAFLALNEAKSKVAEGQHPHRAVLVIDEDKKVIGKIGHLAFLKALEPKYSELGNLQAISQAGINPEVIASIMEDFQFWRGECEHILQRTKKVLVKDIMRPVTENIDENTTLREAIHKIIMWQCLSILVTRGKQVVGILRLSDMFDYIAERIRALK